MQIYHHNKTTFLHANINFYAGITFFLLSGCEYYILCTCIETEIPHVRFTIFGARF